jgi:hypothetical protein
MAAELEARLALTETTGVRVARMRSSAMAFSPEVGGDEMDGRSQALDRLRSRLWFRRSQTFHLWRNRVFNKEDSKGREVREHNRNKTAAASLPHFSGEELR